VELSTVAEGERLGGERERAIGTIGDERERKAQRRGP